MAGAFYVAENGRFVATELTRGPWDPDSQHAGPPAALLGRALEACAPRAGMQIGRVTLEILRPVPIAPLTVEARVLRPGRSVELLCAELRDESGEEVMRATAWRLRTTELALPTAARSSPPLPGPDGLAAADVAFRTGEVGYGTAIEWRFARGAFLETGPAAAWMRMRHPLVAGEEPSALVRVLVAADSGNGISAALDFDRYVFINTDLSVHLHRLPAGEWVALDSVTMPEPSGIGMTDTVLHDEQGPIGRAVQTLFVRERDRR
jgi:hypothetical protein